MNVPFRMADQSSDIIELQDRLKAAREAYYNLSPVIDDATYDALKLKLEELDPQNQEVTAVGAEAPKISVWDKVEHEIPMGSLNKVNSEAEFLSWADKHALGTEYVVCHKLDGSSLELVYVDGELVRGVTRGDGRVGEDVTANIMQIPSIPKTLLKKVPGKVFVRGEVIMHRDVFQTHYAVDYANPRNTAAGKLRDKRGEGKDCKNLEFYGFELVLDQQRPKFELISLMALNSLGFKTPWYQVGTKEQVILIFKEEIQKRDKVPYEIDGEVISINNIEVQDALGSLNMRPRGKIAWKFAAEMNVTTIKDVRWQVGPTGRICPVAVLEPIKIGGVTITNVSLHNLKMFRELQLAPGNEVLVSRRNDVIPYIEKNLSNDSE